MLLCRIRALGVYYLFFKIHDIEEDYHKDLHQSAAAALSMAKDAARWGLILMDIEAANIFPFLLSIE